MACLIDRCLKPLGLKASFKRPEPLLENLGGFYVTCDVITLMFFITWK